MAKRRALRSAKVNRDVFFNCPFDDGYRDFFRAIVFTIMRCGFVARCAREKSDAGQVRVGKIYQIIQECAYGVHDISCTELDPINSLPRFNMPLELGIFFGAAQYGGLKHSDKQCIIFDREEHRYQKFISDIAGQDIFSHENDVRKLISELSDWLRQHLTGAERDNLHGGIAIADEYERFKVELAATQALKSLPDGNLKFGDLCHIVKNWIVPTPAVTAAPGIGAAGIPAAPLVP